MTYPKLLERLAERKRPATVYLSRDAFERAVTRHLTRASAPPRMNAVLHVRLSSYECVRTHLGVIAARKLLRITGSTLLRTCNTVAAVYLGEGAFAVLMSDILPSEAELHADFLVYSISDMRLHRGSMTLCSDAYAGLAIADERRDGKALLAAAGDAGLAAREKGAGRSNAECAEEMAASEAEERFIPSCQIVAGSSLDDTTLAAAPMN